MNIHTPPGTKIIYTGTGASDNAKIVGDTFFIKDNLYTVASIDVDYELIETKEYPGAKFSIWLFQNINI
jgi:hypothetical protein